MANKPTIAERLKGRVCPNCGAKPERKSDKGPPPIFCGRATCKREMNNRLTVEGRAIIGLAKAWRIDRGTGEIATKAFAQMVEILDQLNSQDLAAGRPRADLYAATLLSKGTRYFDRQRPTKGPTVEQRVADEAGPELADEAVGMVRDAMDANPDMAF